MTHEDRNLFVRAILQDVLIPILSTKGPDYSKQTKTEDDCEGNFKFVADRLKGGIDKYAVWGVLFSKHMLAIESWLSNRKVQSEPIDSRLADAINYLFILWAMLASDGIVSFPKSYSGNKQILEDKKLELAIDREKMSHQQISELMIRRFVADWISNVFVPCLGDIKINSLGDKTIKEVFSAPGALPAEINEAVQRFNTRIVTSIADSLEGLITRINDLQAVFKKVGFVSSSS